MRTLFLVGMVMLQGCSAGPSTTAGNQPLKAGDSSRLIDPIDNPGGMSTSDWVQTAIEPLGAVPYDRMVLPLVSPNGLFVATQMGDSPTWPTVLASEDSHVPYATRIEIYRLDRREFAGPEQRHKPALVLKLDEPMLLGRSCDRDGFLVESPREDGSRWIGKAAWETGEIQWLVQGTDVNAFAAIGIDGQMAWSRRVAGEKHFDLVMRDRYGEWTLPNLGDDWLMPAWADDGRLFVLSLSGDKLQACYADATTEQMFKTTLRRLTLASGANEYVAYQTMIGQSVLSSSSSGDALILFHPAMKRMAVWRPLVASPTLSLLREKSVAAAFEDDRMALVADETELIRQSISRGLEGVPIARGLHIPRATPSGPSQFVLLRPVEGQIGLTGMRFLPRETAVPGGAASPR